MGTQQAAIGSMTMFYPLLSLRLCERAARPRVTLGTAWLNRTFLQT